MVHPDGDTPADRVRLQATDAFVGRDVVRLRQPEPCHCLLAKAAHNRERPQKDSQLLGPASGGAEP